MDLLRTSKTYHVDQKVIDISAPDSAHCLMANAIRLAIPGAWSVNVDTSAIRFNVDETRYFWPMSANLAIIAAGFDEIFDKQGAAAARKSVKPFSFRLLGRDGYSRPVVRTGPIKRGKRGPQKNPGSRYALRRYMGLKIIRTP